MSVRVRIILSTNAAVNLVGRIILSTSAVVNLEFNDGGTSAALVSINRDVTWEASCLGAV